VVVISTVSVEDTTFIETPLLHKMADTPKKHEFIAIDEGHATLLHIDERDQSKNWIVPIGQPVSLTMNHTPRAKS
jgi:hypothetical protein